MADDLRLYLLRLALVAFGMVAMPAVGADLVDPMRPPAVLLSGGDAMLEEPTGPVLQSVMMATGRQVAIISGQPVSVGGKFVGKSGDKASEKTLVRLSDHEVVFRDGDGVLETLKMHPAIEKKMIKPAVEAKPKRLKATRQAGASRP